MKIAVYTIALNEEKFVWDWYNSAKDADYLLIADTGSNDNTVSLAESIGINVVKISISPWRFDDARNASLAALPKDIDICISLDMDEVLVSGWREKLEGINPDTTRPRYKYTWSWNEDGTPGLEYGGDKIHARHGYRWKHPVHEVLTTDRLQENQEWIDLEIHHHPDSSKPRSQYLPLLELSVREDPHDDRNAYYYARELFFYGKNDEAVKEFKRYLDLPTARWGAERAAAYRYMAKCQPILGDQYLIQAIEEDKSRRESYVSLSQWYYDNKQWDWCYDYAFLALEIKEKPLDYLCEDYAWGSLPHDLAGIAAYNLGNIEDAIKHTEDAIALSNDPRLKTNLEHYLSLIK
jgi:glycosyltransferase involved in cell wall biosynthesis